MKRYALISLTLIIVLVVLVLGGRYSLARGDMRSLAAAGGAPTVVNYQGQVSVGSTPYDGTGYFKFAVVNEAANTTYWSNDGSSTTADEPDDAITSTVTGGRFNVLLGNSDIANMTPLPASAFEGVLRYLRVWFSDDNVDFTLLDPDQRIAAVPYALQAEIAKDASTLDYLDSSDFWQLGGNAGTSFSTDYLGTSDSVSLTLGVNGLPALTLDTDGNAGVGTTNPTEKLTLEGGNFLHTPGDPVHIGSIVDDSSTELDGPNDIFVQGNYAYIAVFTDNAVEILDISDPSNPTHVSAFKSDRENVHSIFVSGRYAYVTKTYGCLEILDISDPTNPTFTGRITDTATTVLGGASGIYVSGKYAYVAASDENGVAVVDISDPANPTQTGAITDDSYTALLGPRDIFVQGKYAYVTGTDDNGVEILDISDPTNPTHVGAIFDTKDIFLEGPYRIHTVGKYAYVTSQDEDSVVILDVSDPSTPTYVSAITDDTTTALWTPIDIYVAGKYAYVTSAGDDGVEVLDISNPSSPTHVGAITDTVETVLNAAYSIFVQGKYAYVASPYGANGNGIEILDISGLDAPTASIGNISASTLSVNENAQVVNDLYVGNGLQVGPGGAFFDGAIGISENAGISMTVSVGDRFRDNAIIAWASVGKDGSVESISKISTGRYAVTITASTIGDRYLVPMAIAQLNTQPTTAAGTRIVSVNQVTFNTFEVYIQNGLFSAADADFVIIVTGR